MTSAIQAKLSPILIPMVLLALFGFVVQPQASASQQAAPVMTGWGGSRLLESIRFHQSNPASEVFPNENASDMEMQARLLVQKGFNGYRVSFAPYCTNPEGFFGAYNASQLQRSIEVAGHYGLWIVVDYHGHNELQKNSTTACWLTFWQSVVQQFTGSYDRIIWEPLNEPNITIASLSLLGTDYQQWVTQARSLGDNHWIVIQNLCSFACNLPIDQYNIGYPTVSDPLGKLFISLHPYFDYRYHYYEWSNATADTYARGWVQSMIEGTRSTGWPVLNTEGGPGRPFGRLTNGTMITCPDMILNGSSGYCKTNFHFVQTITNLLDNQTTPLQTRLNWLWFPMADWSSTPGAGIYGSLSPTGPGWGTLLSYKKTQSLSFIINASPDTLTIYPGDSKTVLITANSTGYAGGIDLTTTWSTTGPTSSLASSTLQLPAGGRDTTLLTITVPTGTQVGTYNLTVSGSIDLYGSRTAKVGVMVRDFTITTQRQNAHVPAGQRINCQVSLQSLGNFSDNVALSVTSSSSGSNITIDPQILMLTPDQIASANVSFNSTIAGVYHLVIVAKSGSLSHSTSLDMTVEDFEVSVVPYVSNIVAGTNRTFTIQVTSIANFSGTVDLYANISSSEPVFSITPQEIVITPGGTSDASLTVSPSTTMPSGNYRITIYATSKGITHQATASIDVSSGSASPSYTPQFTTFGLQPLQMAGLISIIIGASLLGVYMRKSSRLCKLA